MNLTHRPDQRDREDTMSRLNQARCVCCGRTSYESGMARVDRGPIHFDCWEEHHSDPSGVWPPEHECGVDE